MHSPQSRRARSLAFGIGTACVVLELMLLLAFSHAHAPQGHLFAGNAACAPTIATPTTPVILLRRLELSL